MVNRFPNETDKAWQAFQDFCDLGVNRSLAEVLRVYRNKKEYKGIPPTVSESTMLKWSSQFNWFDRARQFDKQFEADRQAMREAARIKQWEEDVEAFRERNRKAGALTFELAIVGLKQCLDVIKKADLNEDQAIRLANTLPRLIESSQSTEGTALGILQLLNGLNEDSKAS